MKINIKKSNRGKFTDYCGGKVTNECIVKGKASKNPAIRKMATFAANARTWKHQQGGFFNGPTIESMINQIRQMRKMDEDRQKSQLQNNLVQGQSLGQTLSPITEALASKFGQWLTPQSKTEMQIPDTSNIKQSFDLKLKDITNDLTDTINKNNKLIFNV